MKPAAKPVTKGENQKSSVEFRLAQPFHIQRNAKFESGANSAGAQVTEKSIMKPGIDSQPQVANSKKHDEALFTPAI